MEIHQKLLLVDATTGFFRITRYPLGPFHGPVDLGLHLAGRFNSQNIGVGLLAGSIFPGSDRLILTGSSPCWGGFFVSSMGGAGLVFDNLGVNMVALVGKAPAPSILYLNRMHGEEIEVRVVPVDLSRVWSEGRGGVYSLMDHVHEQFGGEYKTDPRVLAVGPAAEATDFGAKDVGATVKYRYDPQFDTGGTFGVNFTTLRGRIIAFNYTSIYLDEADRLAIHEKFILNHYLKQFNEENIQTKQQHACGEPCPAVCKKTRDEFKEESARKLARRLAREKGKAVLDPFIHTAYARKGWMVPNQYWTSGALSPMPIMGKYCVYYTFLKRRRDIEGDTDKDLCAWMARFEKDKTKAALDFWYEAHKGTHEVLREF